MIGRITESGTKIRADDGRLIPLSFVEQQHGWEDGTQVAGGVSMQPNGHEMAYGLTRWPPERQQVYVDPVTGNRYVRGKRVASG